jgi:hypothetical protein
MPDTGLYSQFPVPSSGKSGCLWVEQSRVLPVRMPVGAD